MTKPVAPTLAEIESDGLELLIHCGPCRVLRLYRGRLPGDGATRIDALRFRCSACGALGEPHVYALGNAMMGREQLWPPADA